MAAFEGGFDAEQVDPKKALDPIPAGEYVAVIVESEEKENSKGTGSYHQFTFEVTEGDYKGRKLWARLNLKNPSDEAVGIARAELSAMCRAAGVMKPSDSTDLHNLPMKIKVGLQPRKDTKELTNVIKGYIPREAASPSNSKPAPTTPPWKKKATA